jgi:diguanylate cyclase (GGDEF)-like protein
LLTLRFRAAVERRVRPPALGLLLVTVVWYIVFALNSALSITTRQLQLIALGIMITEGVVGYFAARYAAFPRVAAGMMYAVSLGFGAALAATPGLLLIAVTVPGTAIVGHLFVRQSHQTLMQALVAQQENRRLSLHDPLTGLPNRLQLYEFLTGIGARSRREGRPPRFAVLCLDLDGFKPVNDRYGHEGGDWLLKGIADRLREVTRAEDLVCRIGGDEFVIILPEAGRETAVATARRLVAVCAEPFDLGRAVDVRVGVSVGVALAPEHGTDVDELLSYADDALYRTKREGKGSWNLHEAAVR